MILPPGPAHILGHLYDLALPPATVYILTFVSREYLRYKPPFWLLALAYACSWPLAFTALVQWNDFSNSRRARAWGTIIPPELEHKLPGSVDIIKDMFVSDRTEYFIENFFRWSEIHGDTFNFRVMFEDRIFTSDPEHIKAMLATDFYHYPKGPRLFKQLETLLGLGVFNSDDGLWKFHRTMTRPFFSRDRISHFDIFDIHAEHALNKAAVRFKERTPVDWQDLVSRFTMDSATEFLFGKNVCSLDAPLPLPSSVGHASPSDATAGSTVHPADRFVRAFQEALEATAIRSRFLSQWPLFEFWGDRVRKQMGAINEFIDPIVSEALRKKTQEEKEKQSEGLEMAEPEEDDETLLEHLVKLTDDHKVIKDETLNILLAGRDTTSCTLTFAVYALAEHPDVLKWLREEILRVVGPAKRPTYDDIREMKYMKAFINEVLRLYPPVPVNSRSTIEPMKWKNKDSGQPDFYIPPETRCLYSVLIMHRRKDLWGPDAFIFDPDRFLDERVQKYLVPNPFIFLPFNAGPRICLGQQFAYNEISFMLVRLLQRFATIRLRQDAHPEAVPLPGIERSEYAVDGRERVWMRSHLTAYARNGLWVDMEEVALE